MGNSSNSGKRAKEAAAFGNIFLEIHQDVYTWNETLTGNIYVNLNMPYPGHRLCVKIKGHEKVRFLDREAYHVRVNGRSETRYRTVTRYHSHQIIKQIVVVSQGQMNGNTPLGQYCFPISLVVPPNLPNSFFFCNSRNEIGEIKYSIEAYLEPNNIKTHPKLKFKRDLTIREPVMFVSQNKQLSLNKEVKTCCCLNKGKVNMNVHFEKDFYTPCEECRIMCEVDNKDCTIDIKNVNFKLVQTITLRTLAHSKIFTYDSSSMDLGTVKAGESFVGDQRKLASLKLPPQFEGSFKTADGLAFNPKIALTPSAKGSNVVSQYSLMVISEVDGCLCCDHNPAVAMPVVIQPLVMMKVSNPPIPAGWAPQAMPVANLSIQVNQFPGPMQVGINQQVPNYNMQNNMMPDQQQMYPGSSPQVYPGSYPHQQQYAPQY